MDFRAPEPVICALRDIVERGVFGYSRPPEDLNDTYVRWVQTRQGVRVEEEWLLQSSGVLKSLALAIRAVTSPGAGIILQPPVYFPFPPIIEANGRYVVENPLIEKNREYSIDLDHLDRVAEQSEALLLCNPHNPVGRVFKREELQAVLEVCSRRRLLVISDEIHSDLIMPGHTHSPLYALSKEYDVPVVVLTSTTKTFNLAGLHMGWITVPDPETRDKLSKAQRAAHDTKFGPFPAVAARAAYGECGYWLDALLRYLDGNRATLESELAGTGIRVTPLEGTYLAWLDFRNTGMAPEALREKMLGETGVWLNAGETFGTGGAGFQRMNLATQRSRLLEACSRIKRAFS